MSFQHNWRLDNQYFKNRSTFARPFGNRFYRFILVDGGKDKEVWVLSWKKLAGVGKWSTLERQFTQSKYVFLSAGKGILDVDKIV